MGECSVFHFWDNLRRMTGISQDCLSLNVPQTHGFPHWAAYVAALAADRKTSCPLFPSNSLELWWTELAQWVTLTSDEKEGVKMTWFSGKRPTFHPSAVNPKSFPGDSQGNPWCTLISAETYHNQYLLNIVTKKARPISAQAHHYYQMGCSETGLVLKVASGPWGLEEEERKMEIRREK